MPVQSLFQPTRSPRLFTDLHDFGNRAALIAADSELTYAALADRVADVVDLLGATRRLVLIAGANNVDSITVYLAALAGGHVALLVPADRPAAIAAAIEAYDPDVVFTPQSGAEARERREGTAHVLHPDLALLLSTSGSTGSPKLVRLSHDNLRSNAHAIAESLGITSEDRAITSLPMHYCYGLSVLNSHLVRGAALLITDLSVVDDCFWRLFADHEGTSLAGVPFTFELLNRSGFADRELPTLRYMTQAGGRLAPELVRQFATLGRERGWNFHVMYGQTEATARMAVLPPALASSSPRAIGCPIPGGSFRLEPVQGCDTPGSGELIYRGPNVMMGYADDRADLRAGRTCDELRTGDLARRGADGLYEIIGRRSRFAKIFGLRLDLDGLEAYLASQGLDACCVATDAALHAFVARRGDITPLKTAIASHCSVPLSSIHVDQVESIPLTANGKTDYAALGRLAARPKATERTLAGRSAGGIGQLYAELLGRPDVTAADSFVTLGGDSLSYVEVSIHLGEVLGHLPRDWHTRSIAELANCGETRARSGTSLDTSVLVRALAIVLIVGTHANLFTVLGGAHCLLGIAGYNFARFQLGAATSRRQFRRGTAAIAQIVVPSTIWIAVVAMVSGMYAPATALYLNGVVGQDSWDVQWQFWFLEALVWTLVAAVALLTLPGVLRAERRRPFGFACAVLTFALLIRFAWTGIEAGPTERYTPAVVLWCFALGWVAARSGQPRQRVLVSILIACSVAGFFGDPAREALVAVGLLVVVWLPTLRVPRAVAATAAVLAASSLYVYLAHWQVYPHLEVDHPWAATALSFAAGIAYRLATMPLTRLMSRRLSGPPMHARAGADSPD